MKVVYVARHGCGGNQDEDSVTHALRELGHKVVCVQESDGMSAFRHSHGADLLLFHKWDSPATDPVLRRFADVCVRAFWYFDLVEWPSDPSLARRDAARRRWMRDVLPLVEHGFCTDGDWVTNAPVSPVPEVRANALKLHWLPQGADGRVAGADRTPRKGAENPAVLFAGIDKGGGAEREAWVAFCRRRLGSLFTQVRSGVHREDLRNLVGRSAVTLCPDSPVTGRYWSNRVYNMAGFGGCVLHPKCEYLQDQYEDGTEMMFYSSREEMAGLTDELLNDSMGRKLIGEAALARTLRQHLYVHRVGRLLEVVTGRKEAAAAGVAK